MAYATILKVSNDEIGTITVGDAEVKIMRISPTKVTVSVEAPKHVQIGTKKSEKKHHIAG